MILLDLNKYKYNCLKETFIVYCKNIKILNIS